MQFEAEALGFQRAFSEIGPANVKGELPWSVTNGNERPLASSRPSTFGVGDCGNCRVSETIEAPNAHASRRSSTVLRRPGRASRQSASTADSSVAGFCCAVQSHSR